jgi:hypothetical protein
MAGTRTAHSTATINRTTNISVSVKALCIKLSWRLVRRLGNKAFATRCGKFLAKLIMVAGF